MKRIACLIALLALPATVHAQTLAEIYLESARQAREAQTALEIERMRTFGPQIQEQHIIAAQSHIEGALSEIDYVKDTAEDVADSVHRIENEEGIDEEAIRNWIEEMKLFKKAVRERRKEVKKMRKSTLNLSRGFYAPVYWRQASNTHFELETSLKHLEKLIEENIKIGKSRIR